MDHLIYKKPLAEITGNQTGLQFNVGNLSLFYNRQASYRQIGAEYIKAEFRRQFTFQYPPRKQSMTEPQKPRPLIELRRYTDGWVFRVASIAVYYTNQTKWWQFALSWDKPTMRNVGGRVLFKLG